MTTIPTVTASISDVSAWFRQESAHIEPLLAQYGAVRFQDMHFDDVERFRALAQASCANLVESNPEHNPVDERGDVHTPVAYSVSRKLLWHNENTFNRDWPTRLLFGCAQPSIEGGETPTVDTRLVYRDLDPDVANIFARRGVRYVRRFGLEVGLDWRTAFATDDPRRVEDMCATDGIDYTWAGDHSTLTTAQTRPAIVRHPRTREWVWVAQLHHWHSAALDDATRDALVDLYGPDNLPRSCSYGDGAAIPDSIIEALTASYQRHEVAFSWRQGDALLVDNLLRAHARNPYVGKRTLYVAIGRLVASDRIGVGDPR